MIVAKTVIPNQYWILRQGDTKVGNIEAGPDGFQIKINNVIQQYKSIKTLKQKVQIDFEPVEKKSAPVVDNEVNGFPTTGRPYTPSMMSSIRYHSGHVNPGPSLGLLLDGIVCVSAVRGKWFRAPS